MPKTRKQARSKDIRKMDRHTGRTEDLSKFGRFRPTL